MLGETERASDENLGDVLAKQAVFQRLRRPKMRNKKADLASSVLEAHRGDIKRHEEILLGSSLPSEPP